jgi:hypothetical protein
MIFVIFLKFVICCYFWINIALPTYFFVHGFELIFLKKVLLPQFVWTSVFDLSPL